ncbi:UNVERIFIED_CONTAM: Nudix hydrolase 8 [Sesamum calycinum]|uniref:Nudix hydrolase 8 n=1 Tax=Sesamum calycinum TaxID=2727403 RepID=A0AAW2LYZ1_9LAMI
MELKLFGSKSLSSGSEMMLSSPFLNSRQIMKVIPQSCSCRGIVPRASYPSTSPTGTSAVSQQDRPDSNSYGINGTQGSSSSPFLKSVRVLDAFDDEYDGVGKKGVWLKLPLERSDLVPVAVQEGFQYHHAERSYVMMTYWIPDGPCLLPSNASHHVGVGSFVINDKDEVLVVQEKHSTPGLFGLWKIPTGFIHESEEIYTGAVREVKEETGVDTEFVEVVAFRNHGDDLEIQAAKWMPLDEFVNQPLIQGDSMFKKIIEICIARLGKRYCGLSVHQLVSKFDGKTSSLYFNIVEDQNADCQVN